MNQRVPSDPAPQRLVSLDALRGAIMLLMASSGFGIPDIARSFPDSSLWRVLGYEFSHAEWTGCTLWDLIQPAFMFMVGVALPWSIANRRSRGERFGVMFGHALWRAVLLVLLAVFLTSAWSRQTDWTFPNVLAQIGLGYPFLFLLAFAGSAGLWLGTATILVAYWAAFALHPLPPIDFNWSAVGVPTDWPLLTGFAAHWQKNANFAAAFDVWFLNLFPRQSPFTHNGGGYQTLNFIPSIATMALGVIAGRLLRSDVPMAGKLIRLVTAGFVGIVLGAAIDFAGLCPIVKRIWTPSWVLFSGGLVALMLAAFVALIDWRGWKRWAFPLVVAGMNPITLYCLWQLAGGFVKTQLTIHFGAGLFECLGSTWTPLVERAAVLLVYWLILFWMYRKKIFIRL